MDEGEMQPALDDFENNPDEDTVCQAHVDVDGINRGGYATGRVASCASTTPDASQYTATFAFVFLDTLTPSNVTIPGERAPPPAPENQKNAGWCGWISVSVPAAMLAFVLVQKKH